MSPASSTIRISARIASAHYPLRLRPGAVTASWRLTARGLARISLRVGLRGRRCCWPGCAGLSCRRLRRRSPMRHRSDLLGRWRTHCGGDRSMAAAMIMLERRWFEISTSSSQTISHCSALDSNPIEATEAVEGAAQKVTAARYRCRAARQSLERRDPDRGPENSRLAVCRPWMDEIDR